MKHAESQTHEPILLTEGQAARLLGFSKRTLQGWRSDGGPGLPFVRISKGCVRYRRTDIDSWLEGQLRRSTSDDAARGTVLRRKRDDGDPVAQSAAKPQAPVQEDLKE